MWKTTLINCALIEKFTLRAVLLRMPYKSKYFGYSFWHPQSLLRPYGNGRDEFVYNTDFKFNLIPEDKSLPEIELSVTEFEKVMNITDDPESSVTFEPTEHIPEEKTPVKVEVEEELKDE